MVLVREGRGSNVLKKSEMAKGLGWLRWGGWDMASLDIFGGGRGRETRVFGQAKPD